MFSQFKIWRKSLRDYFAKFNPIILVVLATTLGFIIGERIFFIDGCIDEELITSHLISRDVFNTNPDFLTWVTLFIIHNGIAMALGSFSVYYIVTLIKKFPISLRDLSAVIIVVLLMIVASSLYVLKYRFSPFYHWPQSPLKNQDIKLLILLSISILSASTSVAGMLITSICAKKAYKDMVVEAKSFSKYLKLKTYLDNFAIVSGVIFSSGIITVFYFYQAVNNFSRLMPQNFGINTVIIFGLIFSLFIACAFVPAKFTMNQIGYRLVDYAVKHPDKSLEIELKVWLEEKSLLEKTLMLNMDMAVNLKQVIPIISPLVSSIIPAVLVSG